MSVFLSVGAGSKMCCLEFLERLRPFIHLVVAENNYSTSQVWRGRKGLRYCGIGLFLVRFCGNFYFKVRYCGFQSPSGMR